MTRDGLNRLPFEGIIFVGAEVVETDKDLSAWSGFLQEVKDDEGGSAGVKSDDAADSDSDSEPEGVDVPSVARAVSKARRRRSPKREGL
jgi:hypothetical protein